MQISGSSQRLFGELCSSRGTLGAIGSLFDAEGFDLPGDYEWPEVSQRRSLVAGYHSQIDFTDPSATRRLLRVYDGGIEEFGRTFFDYRGCMGLALAELGRNFPRLDQDERLEIYDEVWTRLLERHHEEGFWPDRIEPYLLAAVANQAISEHRRRDSRKTDPSDPLSGPIASQLDKAMEEGVIGRLDGENIEALIASLTPLQATVAKLRFDWALTPDEIAARWDSGGGGSTRRSIARR